MEKSSWRATLGKRFMNISIYTSPKRNSQAVLLRNILKFLPWEIAHCGVHWIVYYSTIGIRPPIWVWMVLILPQVIALAYVISVFLYKGESSIYDKIANTSIDKQT